MTRGAAGALSADDNPAVSFNGSDGHVQLAPGFENLSGGLTLEAWVKPTSVAAFQRVFDLGNGPGADNVVLYRQGTSDALSLQVFRDGTSAWISASGALVLNQWQHLAATVSAGGVGTIYRNGAVVAQDPALVSAAIQDQSRLARGLVSVVLGVLVMAVTWNRFLAGKVESNSIAAVPSHRRRSDRRRGHLVARRTWHVTRSR